MTLTITQNLFLALAMPFLIAPFLLKGSARRFMAFSFLGITFCLISSYINTFLVAASQMDTAEASIKWTPIIEEILKALPVLFYGGVFTPKSSKLHESALAVGIGFATLENASYLLQFGQLNPQFALIRGLSTGLMHTACAAILGYGLAIAYERGSMRTIEVFAILSATATYHAIFNLLVQASGVWLAIGYLLPIASIAAMLAVRAKREKSPT
jgi:RsiW-degrading membrane proteinase PrsW (M82 family)